MPASKTDPKTLSDHVREIIKDGNWHTLREIYYKVEGLIRPEVAVRLYNKVEDRKVQEPLEKQIEKGKIAKIVMTLSDIGCERRGNQLSWTREYRLNPDRSRRNEYKAGGSGSLRDTYGREALRALGSVPIIGSVLTAMSKEPFLDQRLTPIQLHWFRKAVEEVKLVAEETAAAEALGEMEDTHMVTT